MKFIAMINLASSSLGIRETLLRVIVNADDKKSVKDYLLLEHPQFFNGKVNQRKSEDSFTYTNIFELDDYWHEFWTKKVCCEFCGFESTNIDLKNQGIDFDEHSRLCRLQSQSKKQEESYFKNKIYIYRITQKSTKKCYVGQTKNHFIWRWWEHVRADSSSKFHKFMEAVDFKDLIFEVIDIASDEKNATELEAFHIEKNNSISNGFNTNNPIKNYSSSQSEIKF